MEILELNEYIGPVSKRDKNGVFLGFEEGVVYVFKAAKLGGSTDSKLFLDLVLAKMDPNTGKVYDYFFQVNERIKAKLIKVDGIVYHCAEVKNHDYPVFTYYLKQRDEE